jgi:hypothetical protein
VYDLLAVTHLVARPDKLPRAGPTTAVLTSPSKLVLYERRGSLPRAAIVYGARWFDTEDTVLAALRAPIFDPGQEVLLLGSQMLAAGPGGQRAAQAATITREEPDLVEIAATAEQAAYLVVADAYYPGWRAEVDGQPAPVERANYAFRAVPLPPGSHTVRLIFDPPLWRLGWWIATPAAIATAVLLVLPFWLRRAKRPARPALDRTSQPSPP